MSLVLYRDKDRITIGGVRRYIISYETKISPGSITTTKTQHLHHPVQQHIEHPQSPISDKTPSLSLLSLSDVPSNVRQLYFRLKNNENTSLRAIHLLNGPLTVYCHVVPCNFSHKKEFSGGNYEVLFRNEIKPGQAFNVPLLLNNNSLHRKINTDTYQYRWSVDVISQIVMNTTNVTIHYDLVIGKDLQELKKLTRGGRIIRVIEGAASNIIQSKDDDESVLTQNIFTKHYGNELMVEKSTGEDLWNTPPQNPNQPAHLVIVSHGIFSNTRADMLYLKDSLESKHRGGQNIIVRGYLGNVGRTERGVKRLGTAVAEFIVETIENIKTKQKYTVNKISFIGHSLGGVVQLYAIKYIIVTRGVDYFSENGIDLEHLVCMASPLLGILNEMNFIISWFLDIGALGRTGRDLTLLRKIPTFWDIRMNNSSEAKKYSNTKERPHIHDNFKPLLEMLPNDPLQGFLKKFNHLTLYANAVNDGIVPLRTSSLLYLDWDALGVVGGIKERERKGDDNPELTLTKEGDRRNNKGDLISAVSSVETVRSTDAASVGEVPEDEVVEEQLGGQGPTPSKTENPTAEVNSNEHDGGIFLFQQILDYFIANKQKRTNIAMNKRKKNKKLSSAQQRFRMISAKGTDVDLWNGSERSSTIASTEDDDDQIEEEDEVGGQELEQEQDGVVKIANDDGEGGDDGGNIINIPPRASAIESALNTIICPVPSSKFITNPGIRPDVIFHDKYYSFEGVPEHVSINLTRNVFGQFFFKHHDSKANKQVKIARKYHYGLTWRKVLVHLPPDAHNNIVVRRRFSNGYGWGVVDHLVEMFQESQPKM